MSTKVKVIDCGLDGLTFTEPSLCKPQFADDCDLSIIIRRFLKTGELPQSQVKTSLPDGFDLSQNVFEVIEPAVKLRQEFDQLPLDERNRFNNDPESWISEKFAPDGAKDSDPQPDKADVDKAAQDEAEPSDPNRDVGDVAK